MTGFESKRQMAQAKLEPTPWRDMVVVSLVREGINKHKARELADHFAAQQAQSEPFEYWNAVEGWVKIDEVREHFDSVGCGTIYKTAGEDRVPVYTAPSPCPTCEALARTVMLDQTSHDTTPPAAQRPWVGLTDEDKKKIATAAGCTEDDDGHIVMEIFRLAETKLKEKNDY